MDLRMTVMQTLTVVSDFFTNVVQPSKGINMSDYSIKLGDSVGSGIHVHSQGELYPVILMYIGQEKVFTYANKVLPYSMKQQVVDAIADGTPAIRELFSTSTRELYTF